MSEKLLGRRCVLSVDELEIEGLRVAFKIHKDSGSTPNTAEIRVSNLAMVSRKHMQKKGAKVILAAGYEENVAIIFSGDARLIDHVRDGSNWVTKIQCGDGERAYSTTRVSEAFKAGTQVKDVIKHHIAKMGIDAGNAHEKLNTMVSQFVNGYSAHGRAAAELDHLFASHGLEWSIQDGRLMVLAPNEASKEAAVELSPETGLVGSPELGTSEKEQGAGIVKVRSLLQPRIRPGIRLVVDSEAVKGTLRVRAVDHMGDTHGGDWYSVAEAVPVQ